jgi:hypothetical protein
MDSPTIREVMHGEQYCSGGKYEPGCDYVREVEPEERQFPIDEFFERIERIEKALGLSE